jgi:hypothetical protein
MGWDNQGRSQIKGEILPEARRFYTELAIALNFVWGGKPQPIRVIEAIALDPIIASAVEAMLRKKFPGEGIDNSKDRV